jgi:nicotinamide mononucleotide transporter
MENILVYPVGLINTVIYIYLSIKGDLYGEASVNLYYTIVSFYGWVIWAKKDNQHHPVLHITKSTSKEWGFHILFFAIFFIAIYSALVFLRSAFNASTIPWADAFASATAFTGMWLMAKKKVESWYWWIATDIASIPLYFAKGYVFTSVYYFILFFMAIVGLIEWQKRSGQKFKHA